MNIEDRDTILRLSEEAFLSLCHQESFRTGGPGGQHRNRRNTAIRLIWSANLEWRVYADEDRSQKVNRIHAIKRLKRILAFEWRMPFQGPWAGSWNLNPDNPEYNVLLAHVLDALAECSWQLKEAAIRLGISVGQLSRWITREKEVREYVNRKRREHGFHPLRMG